MKNCYTFIMTLDGGTYIAQFKAKNFDKSVLIWLDGIMKTNKIRKAVGKKIIAKLSKALLSEEGYPSKIRKVDSVWHSAINTAKGMCEIHIINTAKASD